MPTSTTISSTPAVFLHPITLTATVALSPGYSGSAPTGNVTFMEGTTPLGTVALGIVNGVNQASLTTSTLSVGVHPILAVYGGDANSAASTSPRLLSSTITTVAGSGAAGYGGDGGPGLEAQLNGPTAMAVDASGNIYVADTGNNRVRKITPAGVITTVAGNGSAGSPAVGSVATQAPIGSPHGVAVDPSGNLFIAYGGGTPILKVDQATQTISYFGAIHATISSRLATDMAGNVYLSAPTQSSNSESPGVGLVRIDQGTQVITTIGLAGVGGLAINPAGDITGTDYHGYTPGVSRILAGATSSVTLVPAPRFPGFSGDGGPAIAALVNGPKGVALDSAGDVYIADSNNNRIRVISPSGVITTIAGNGTSGFNGDNGTPTATALRTPSDVVVDAAGNLYIADTANNRIRVIRAFHVLPGNVATALNASPAAPTYGQAVTLTAIVSVASAPPGAPAPTGTVTFRDGTTFLGTSPVTIVAGVAQASLTTSTIPAGARTITATYSGDPTYNAGSPATLPIAVAKATTLTSLTASNSTPTYGQPVTFTATVASVPAGGMQTGAVAFMEGGTTLATVPLNAAGVATFTTPYIWAGFHSFHVSYAGDANNQGGTSAPQDVTVAKAPLTVTANNATRPYGQANPSFTARYSGFVLGETQSSLGGQLTFSTPAAVFSEVGTYPVTPGGLTAINYSLSFVPGSLTVLPVTQAIYVSSDATTGGNWKGVYGHDGFTIIGDTSANNPSLPPYATVDALTSSGGNVIPAPTSIWAGSTADPRALQKAALESPDRIAAAWRSPTTISVHVGIAQGQPRLVSLYFLDWDNQGRSQTISLTDDAGRVLDTRTLSGFQNGVYLSWSISGNCYIDVTSTNPAVDAVVSGLFIGGASAPASASFVASDAAAQGNWKGSYGSEGYWIAQDASAGNPNFPPSVATVSASGASDYVWTTSSTDPRYLQKSAPGSTDRIGAGWYAFSSMSFAIDLADNALHRVSIYAQDAGGDGRTQTVQVLDTITGVVLDTRTLANFQTGVYLTWNVSGHVTIRITNTGPTNAVVSGLFIGGAPAPASASFVVSDVATQGNWKGSYGSEGYWIAQDASAGNPNFPPSVATVSASGASDYVWTTSSTDPRYLQKAAPGSTDRIGAGWYSFSSMSFAIDLADGNTHRVSIYAQDVGDNGRTQTVQVIDTVTGVVLDTRTLANFQTGVYLTWEVSGDVTIRVTNTGPTNAVISGLFISHTPTSASFLAADTATGGNWKPNYGSEGFKLAQDPSPNNPTLPPYAAITLAGQSDYVWTTSSTDPRYLQKAAPGSTDRIGAGWYSFSSMSFAIDLTDNALHRVSIYAQDVGDNGRTQTVQVIDTVTGVVLDTRILANFQTGVYLAWNVSGHVTIRITNTGPTNAVVSGLFIDPAR